MSKLLQYTGRLEVAQKDFGNILQGSVRFQENEGGLMVNRNFFSLGEKVDKETINSKIKIFDERIVEIKGIIEDVKASNISNLEKKLLFKILNANIIKFVMFKNAIYLDAEKAGFELTDKEREIYHTRVMNLQTLVFGRKISDIAEEKEAVINILNDIYLENGNRLNDAEKIEFETFIESFGVKLKPNIQETNTKEHISEKEIKLHPTNDYTLPAETARQAFEMVFDINGFDGWKAVIKPTANATVNYKAKELTLPEKAMESYSLTKIFELFDHEVGTHSRKGFENDKSLKVQMFGNEEVEEGFATLATRMVTKKYEDVSRKPNISHVTTFIGENLDGENTEKILRIYFKLKEKANTPEEKINELARARAHRVKGFVAWGLKGAGRKDVSYTRGLSMIMDYIDGLEKKDMKKFIRDFYYAQLSLEDMKLVDELREVLGDIGENNFNYPIWLGKILYNIMNSNNPYEDNEQAVIDKLELIDLQREDIRMQAIEEITKDTKNKVAGLLTYINKNKIPKKS